jgi:GH18 family chitinase
MIGCALILLALAPSEVPALGSQHARDLELHQHVVPFRAPPALRLGGGGPLETPRVNKIVYGYYPYWISQWENIRWDLLTHIAYFAVEINSSGGIDARHGWPDTNFVDTAHIYGVRVDLCFTLFSGSGIAALVGSPTRRADTIEMMITEMEAGGADGINIDFEGLESGTRDNFTTFIRELREALDSRMHHDKRIGIAGPAVDWTNSFDLLELSRYIETYFIMGYGYHWGGSSKAGPMGQLRVTDSWRPHISISYERTLDHYTSLVPPELRSKIILGVPYYGEEWPVSSLNIHAATTGTGSSRTYAVARRAVEGGRTRNYDLDAENAWYSYSSGGVMRQTWYDDEESMASKYQLALEQDIGGVGMWALGYDEAYPELWSVLDAYFTAEPEQLSGSRENPIVISEFPYAETNDTRLAPSNYFNRYSCNSDLAEYGREWVYRVELCEPGTLAASVTDATGVDIDIHLLSAPLEGACLARADLSISEELAAGTYYLVADTYVLDYVAQAGGFELAVDFIPLPGSTGCAPPKMPAQSETLELLEAEVRGTISRAPDIKEPIIEPQILPEEEGCACTMSARTGGQNPLELLAGFVLLAFCFARRK